MEGTRRSGRVDTRVATATTWIKEKYGLTISQMARDLNLTRMTVHRWISGNCRPNLRMVEKTYRRFRQRDAAGRIDWRCLWAAAILKILED